MCFVGRGLLAGVAAMGKRRQKTDKTGRSKSGDKFVKVFLCTMQSPAWQALSPYAQRLYPWLLLEFNGPHHNNNGRISYSVRQAARALGCNTETARRAFLNLQAKGFLVVTRCAGPGAAGKVRSHEYQITELGTAAKPVPRKLYRDWKPGCDFPVVRAKANNPRGIGGIKNLETELTERDGTPRTELTDGYTPNLPDRTDKAKNAQNRTYGVRHPYLPGGSGEWGKSDAAPDSVCNKPPKAAKPSPKNPESKNCVEFSGEPRTFAVVRGGVPIRVGVRTMRRGNMGARVA